MKALILAAGEGTRMAPLTDRRPKPMLPVAGRPLVAHIIESLKANGINDILVLAGANRERLEDLLDVEGILGSVEIIEQKKRLGTAHAIGQAEDHVDGDLIVVNGDVLANNDTIAQILKSARAGADVVIASAIRKDMENYGVLQCVEDDKGLKVESILEKPDIRVLRNMRGQGAVGRVNAGIYYFRNNIFDYIRKTPLSSRGEYEITDTLTMMIEDGFDVRAVDFAGPWLDLCYPWDLLTANTQVMKDMFQKRKEVSEGSSKPENVHVYGNVIIEDGAQVLPGTVIEGNVIIKEGAKVGPNCYIRGSTVIGRNCRVGNAVEIKNSIIMDNSNVPHHNYVGDSVIGSNCNLGSGTKIANLRLDNKNVRIMIKDRMIDTGSRKIGAFLGDGVKTGINACLLPGTLVGADSFIGPGAVVKGVVSRDSKVF